MKKEYAKYLIDKTKSDYNLIAKEFSSTRETPWQELSSLFDYIENNDKVLDLGCGNGRCYDFLKDKNIGYIGIDNSEKLVGIAKQRYPGINFQTGDALNLSFPENSFDKVFSIAVLHHIPSKGLRLRFLKEAKKVLNPGGLLILTAWKFHQPKEFSLLFKNILLKLVGLSKLDFMDILEPWGKKAERYYHWFSKKELRDLAKETGFMVQKTGVLQNQRGNRQNIYLIAKKEAPIA